MISKIKDMVNSGGWDNFNLGLELLQSTGLTEEEAFATIINDFSETCLNSLKHGITHKRLNKYPNVLVSFQSCFNYNGEYSDYMRYYMQLYVDGRALNWNGFMFETRYHPYWIKSDRKIIELNPYNINKAIKTELKLIYPHFKKLKI